jgi:hypothetical protein
MLNGQRPAVAVEAHKSTQAGTRSPRIAREVRFMWGCPSTEVGADDFTLVRFRCAGAEPPPAAPKAVVDSLKLLWPRLPCK